MDSLGEIIGIAGDSAGNLEHFPQRTASLIFIKVVVALADITSESMTLYYAKRNRDATRSHITVTIGNKTVISKVDQAKLQGSFLAYFIFFVFNVFAFAIIFAYQLSRILKRKRSLRFISLITLIFLEIPLLIAEVSMLKARVVIDWNTQLWSLITHIVFVIQFFLTATIDYFCLVASSDRFSANICAIPIIFAAACMAYTPVFLTITGFKLTELTDLTEFEVEEHVERAFEILFLLGILGIFFWMMTFLYIVYLKSVNKI